jgi:hypothetical protein
MRNPWKANFGVTKSNDGPEGCDIAELRTGLAGGKTATRHRPVEKFFPLRSDPSATTTINSAILQISNAASAHA